MNYISITKMKAINKPRNQSVGLKCTHAPNLMSTGVPNVTVYNSDFTLFQ